MTTTRSDAVRARNRGVMRQALNIKGVSHALNCSDKTTRKLIERGELRAFRVGTEYRVLPEDLHAFITSQMESA
jgi:excisionase family DNA binding protein